MVLPKIPEYDDDILNWIVTNGLTNSKGEPFEWKYHEFLLGPLCDWHPRQAYNKASQLGASETIGILKSLYAASELGLNVVYTLPTDQFLQKFVPPKFDQIVAKNPVLAGVSGGQQLKQVPHGDGKRFIYFMGTHSSKAADRQEESDKGVSVTSDLNIHDEASRSDQFILNQLRSRLDASQYKGRWLFDNPTYPHMGADAVFKKSDQRVWVITCHRCGYKQYVDWARLDKQDFESGSNHAWVDPAKKRFICGRCRRPLTDEMRMQGEWVARHPGRDARGYWMPKMLLVNHTVTDLMDIEDDPNIHSSFFHNFSLAKPYIGSDVKLSRADIVENWDNGVNTAEHNAMGVDQGVLKHYVIGNEQGIFEIGVTDDWEEIERLKLKHKAKMVVDALPSQRFPKIMADKYTGDVWRAFYKPESDQTEVVKFGTKADHTMVLIKREEFFDIVVDKFLDKESPFQIPIVDMGDYIRHWESLVRIVEEDRQGNQRFKWQSVNGEDHFAHATLYFYAALQRAAVGKVTVNKSQRREKDELRTGIETLGDETYYNAGAVLDQAMGLDKSKNVR